MAVSATQEERNALRMVIGNRDPELLTRLRTDMFGTQHLQNIIRVVHGFYAEHGEVMGWDVLKSELERRVPDGEKMTFFMGLVDDLKEQDVSGLSPEALLETLDNHRKLRVLLSNSRPLIDAVEMKDVDAALGHLQDMYDKVHDEVSGIDMQGSDMVNLAGRDIKFNFRKTGIEGIDRRGGLIEGGLTIVGAAAKAGKSTLAGQFALHNHDHYEGSTAIFSFEQGAQELRARILSNRANVDLGLIMSKMLDPVQMLKLREAEAAHLCNFTDNMKDYINDTMDQSDQDFWPSFWERFEPRSNRFYLFDRHPDWDELFAQMELLHKTKGVRMFVIDYPYLVGRGARDRSLASWEYNLLQSKNLKKFARRNKVWVVTPAQYDSNTDSLKFVKNAVNDCDLYIAMKEEEGDADVQPGGAVTCSFKAYRNYLSIPDEPQLKSFKLLREFNHSRLRYFAL